MNQIIFARLIRLAILLLVIFFSSGLLQAQTPQFTYQGRLTDSGSPANGAYDLQFKLYDAVTGGTQIGITTTLEDVAVSNGNFNVTLDFGSAAFPGANRWLEIGVRPGASMGAFTTLTPRQPLTSTPYAIRSLNAATADGLSVACVNCVTSAQIGSLPANSVNYIQNTTTQQAGANFNISGNGTAGGTLSGNIVSATTQFNIGSNRVLSSSGNFNLFAGAGAGAANTTGGQNAFFGPAAGVSNTTGSVNAFFGQSAGAANTSGGSNSFFGQGAGASNTTAFSNSFFGTGSGTANTTGDRNAFFGTGAGAANTTGLGNTFFGHSTGSANTIGNQNAFFGRQSGNNNTTGSGNAFFGHSAGLANTTGGSNTVIGFNADVGSGALNYATAIGAGAIATTSSQIQLGRNGLDTVSIGTMGTTGGNPLCLNGSVLSSCPPGSGGGTITGVTAGTGLIGGGTTGTVTIGLAPSGVTANELAANAVTTAKLADGSVTDAKIVSVTGSKISGTIPVAGIPAGSPNYIQNSTTQQANSNFNISGDGLIGRYLGIGTMNPLRSLHSVSPTNSSEFVMEVADGLPDWRKWNFVVNGGTNQKQNLSLRMLNDAGAGASIEVMGWLNNGNVGIGTTAPSERLHVVGNGLVTGNFTVNGTLTGNIAASSIIGVLPIGNGGTGLSTSGAAGNYLRSNGTNWTSSALQAADLPGGSASYIQNTTSFQASANFNIGGNGTAGGTLSGNVVNATTQFNLGGSRILSNAGTNNLFVGVNAGLANPTGPDNTFFGAFAGRAHTTGESNAFFGSSAGSFNTSSSFNAFFGAAAGTLNTGNYNSFFGALAGNNNTAGEGNAFFGYLAGFSNKIGSHNAFFGNWAGHLNTGFSNAFFGAFAGNDNTTGSDNSFFGRSAGLSNTTGNANAFFGTSAGAASTTASSNVFVGNSAGISNKTGTYNVFVGRNAGYSNTIGSQNTFVGFEAGKNTASQGGDPLAWNNTFAGYQTGFSNTTGYNNAFFGISAGYYNSTGKLNTFLGSRAGIMNQQGSYNTYVGAYEGDPIGGAGNYNTSVGFYAGGGPNANNSTSIGAFAWADCNYCLILGDLGTNVGIGTQSPIERLQVVGNVRIGTSGTDGCIKRFDGAAIAGTCSSDARFKRDITSFPNLLEKVTRLRPVHYYWRAEEFPQQHFGHTQAYGLVAQEVEQVLPELVSTDEQGFKMVDYAELPLLLLQSVKELKAENEALKQQQTQLATQQQQQLKQQQDEIEALKRLVCHGRPQAAACRVKQPK